MSRKSIYNQELPENVSLLSNISHNDVLNIYLRKYKTSVVTSDFESLSLPIYEGLLFKKDCFGKSSEYIYSNVVAIIYSRLNSIPKRRKLEFFI